MDDRTGRILKADEVKTEGSYHLEINQAHRSASPVSRSVSSTPQVRIVENYPEYVVLEMICTCGIKTRVRCEYNIAN